mgnify:FL=1
MIVKEQIRKHISSIPEPKHSEMQQLHQLIQQAFPACKLWFDDGKNNENKTVTNPTIGYGSFTIKYADGKSKEFFQVGLSANTTGMSVYILGIKDKSYLAKTYAEKIGKAKVTGYCIRFKKLEDINTNTLEDAIRYGAKASLQQ